jgi:predicted secreted protein
MATLTGENGTVKYGTDSAGSFTAVAEVRSWTVEHTKDVIEDTVMGDAARTFKAGLHAWTGSMEIMVDTSLTGEDNAILNPSDDAALFVQFYPNSSTGEYFQGEVLVTSVSRNASFDDMVTASVSFQGTGPLTYESL